MRKQFDPDHFLTLKMRNKGIVTHGLSYRTAPGAI